MPITTTSSPASPSPLDAQCASPVHTRHPSSAARSRRMPGLHRVGGIGSHSRSGATRWAGAGASAAPCHGIAERSPRLLTTRPSPSSPAASRVFWRASRNDPPVARLSRSAGEGGDACGRRIGIFAPLLFPSALKQTGGDHHMDGSSYYARGRHSATMASMSPSLKACSMRRPTSAFSCDIAGPVSRCEGTRPRLATFSRCLTRGASRGAAWPTRRRTGPGRPGRTR